MYYIFIPGCWAEKRLNVTEDDLMLKDKVLK